MNNRVRITSLVTLGVIAVLLMAGIGLSQHEIATADGPNCPPPSWAGSFYNNIYFFGEPALTACNASVNFNWGYGSPAPAVNADNFSARWVGTQVFPQAGTYQFTLTGVGGLRLYVNEQPIIDSMDTSSDQVRTVTGTYTIVVAGQTAFLRLEYAHNFGPAQIALNWSLLTASQPPTQAAPPTAVVSTTPLSDFWVVNYFSNETWSGSPVVTQTMPADGINRNYGWDAPAPGMPADRWSARWVRQVNFPAGNYTFYLRADDGAHVYVDGQPVVRHPMTYRPGDLFTGSVNLTGGLHIITVEYREITEKAHLFLTWDPMVATTLLTNGCNGETAGIDGSSPRCPERAAAAPSYPVVMGTISTIPVRLYSGPSDSTNLVSTLNQMTQVAIVERTADNRWLRISTSGASGWVQAYTVTVSGSLDTVRVEGTTAAVQPTPLPPAPTAIPVLSMVKAKALGNMRIRSGPGTQYERVAGIGWGTIVNVIGKNADGTWIQVETDGVIGWSARTWYEIVDGNLRDVPVTWGGGVAQQPLPVQQTTSNCAYAWFFTFNRDEAEAQCPGPIYGSRAIGQNFEGGRAYVYEAPTGSTDARGTIFIIYNDGTWETYVNTYDPATIASTPLMSVPAGRYQPTGALGYLWYSNQRIRDRLGWAYGPETAFNGRIQRPLGNATYFYIDHGYRNLVLRLYYSANGNRWESVGRY